MRFGLRTVLLSLLMLAGVTCSTAGPDSWPGWRGPASNGVSALKNLPSAWSHYRNVAWKTVVPGRGPHRR
jgi:outer membrane protein assembly factor BamB